MALAVALPLAVGCGDDGDGAPSGRAVYDVVLVVGAADPPTIDVGTEFAERWTLDCDDSGCTLARPAGEPLGDLRELRLEPAEDGDELRGAATGVRSAGEPSSCAGTPTITWTVEIELARDDDLVVGSAIRVPEPTPTRGCEGVDLTLGFSGTTTR